MKIEVEKTEDLGWKVSVGDRYEDHLGSDEALWCVVSLMTDTAGPGYTKMRTQAEHDKWNEKYGPKKPLEEHQKLLAPITS